MPKEIKLTNGKVAIVDDEDFEYINQYKWRAHLARGKWYADNNSRFGIFQSMHRLILNAPDGVLVDHINGDGLDNRRENLRLCTSFENARNTKISKANTTGFKGVSKNKRNGKYRAYIMINKVQIFLGVYETALAAAEAYNGAATRLFGNFAWLNTLEKKEGKS